MHDVVPLHRQPFGDGRARSESIEQRIDRAYLAVVHAMAESAAPSGHGRETNPGMFGTVLTAWNDQLVNYTHPPAEDVEGLIDEAIDVANTAQAPACLRVASLTFTLLSARADVADRHGARLIAIDQFGLVRDQHDQCGKRASRLAPGRSLSSPASARAA